MSTAFEVYTIFSWIFVGLSLFSNLLSLQTFLFTRKIRETNCGIYLILFSIICIIVNLVLPLKDFSISIKSFQISVCAILDLVIIPSISCLQWLNGFIACERVLIEWCEDIALYDSRKRSILASLLLILIQTIWNSFPNIFCRQNGITINTCDGYLNRTGKILLSIFFYKEILPFLLFILSTILFIYHLGRHHTIINSTKLTFVDLIHLCSNHLDFFTPLIIYTVSVLPTFIYYAIYPYYDPIVSREKDILGLVFELIYHFSTTLTFFSYVYANKVYRNSFWMYSPIGCCLRRLKSFLF